MYVQKRETDHCIQETEKRDKVTEANGKGNQRGRKGWAQLET